MRLTARLGISSEPRSVVPPLTVSGEGPRLIRVLWRLPCLTCGDSAQRSGQALVKATAGPGGRQFRERTGALGSEWR